MLGQIASAISQGLSNMQGTIGQIFTNKQNKKLFREQQQQAWQMQLQNQMYQTASQLYANKYNEEMYNKYSSPAALMRQYREAGLNPYAMMSPGAGGSPATATSNSGGAGTSPSPIPMKNPLENFAVDAQRMSDAINGALQQDGIIAANRKIGAEADLTEVHARTESERVRLELMKFAKENDLLDDQHLAMLLQNSFNTDTYGARVDYTKGLNSLQSVNQRLMESQAAYNDVLTAVEQGKLKYLDQRQRAELANIYTTTKSIVQGMLESDSRIQVNERMAEKLVHDTVEAQWRASEMRVKAEVAKETKEWMIDKIKAETEHAWSNSGPDGFFGVPNLLGRPGSIFRVFTDALTFHGLYNLNKYHPSNYYGN